MPAGFNQHSSDTESIVGVQFSILSPEEIERSSVVEITTQTPYEGNEPKIGGLFDPRMGVLDNGKICRTCGQTNHGCPGHFGHYRLTRPVYYIQFIPYIMNVLKCICIRCSKLRIDKNSDVHKDLLNRKGEARWKAVLALSANIKRCGQECEDGCGAPQPDKFTREGIARIIAHYQGQQHQQQPLEVEYVHRLFRRITDEDVDFMGLSRYWCRPDWMICTVLRIPPPQVRPSVVQDNNQRSEDDLTHKLFDIIKNDKTLQLRIEGNSSKNVIDEMTNVVQYHVATLIDNNIPGVAPSAQRSGRPLKSIQQRLGGKEGRIRYNIQGKRVEFSARSVITPDPNISVAEIGVPLEIAMNLTSPERVTPYNLTKLYKLVQNGADTWPGAKTIVRKDGRMISLKHVNTSELVLYEGDVVNRHLLDNDILLFNRQPTLHKMSMMGHRVKVLPYKTFRLNVLVTRPYNADFDGDEMNAHIPQSYEAMVELEDIAAVPHHIITPRHAKPMIGIYQDTLVGSYLLTQEGIKFNRREFMNLMMWNKRFNGVMPLAKANTWSGQQVLGALLPPINLEMGNKMYDNEQGTESTNYVKIKHGVIEQGVVDGDIYMKPSKGIVHVTYNDHGPKETVDLLDSLQNTVENFLVLNGFSVGISDLIADEETKQRIDTMIQERKKQVEQVILQVHLDLFDNNTGKTNQQEFEDQIFGILNQATSDAGSAGQQSLSSENRLLAMVRSGSKGEPLNVAQMMACLGQTAIEGKRVPYGFTDRTLPHYKKYDDSSEARGFIESSFIRGLTPQQFFFHAMSGREGLIDTAVKSVTSNTEIVIMEKGHTKWTTIGSWIDGHIDGADPSDVEHHKEANMELLKLKHEVFIPTCDDNGVVTWGQLTAVTRHDPGECLYDVHTKGGRHVTVAKSQSLLVWNDEKKQFLVKPSPEVKVGDYLPVTVQLCDPPTIITHIDMKKYANKLKGPNYSLPEKMELNERNGIFFGLYLAEGNSHIQSGYVSIANNDQTIRTFAMEWFQDLGINVKERFRSMENKTRTGVTKSESHGVRGFSRLLGQFLEKFLGAGSANKFVPDEAFGASKEFIRGLLNGYFSGDGTVDVKKGSITVGSASKKLIEGISFLCSRFGIFGKVSKVQLKSNNVMTPVERILPTYRYSICAKWATLFAKEIPLILEAKQERLTKIHHQHEHRNFAHINDVAKDEVVSIQPMSVDAHPKLYDVTVPSTLNFAIANGINLADTADTGYIQRQLIKSMEDLIVHHDGTVRDTHNNIVQFHYGEDGINPTKIETQSLPIGKLSKQQIETDFKMAHVDWSQILIDGTTRENDEELLTEFANELLFDQRMMVEGVFQKKSLDSGSVFAPVNLARWILNIKVRCGLNSESRTDLTPAIVLTGIKKIIERTHPYHKIWQALLRFHLAPHKIIAVERFTKNAFEMLMELIVVSHMKSWVQPGEQVGIVAAQSIGEPATQMSATKHSLIVLQNDKNLKYYGSIGEICDSILEQNKEKVITIGKDSVVLPLEENYYIVGVSENEKTSWKRISEISRHPANGGLVEVVTRTGRKTTATLTHSFLKRSTEGIVPVLGSDLQVGMRIPIARVIPETPNPSMEFIQGKTTFVLNREFGWVCGMYLADGSFTGNIICISKVNSIVEERLIAFASQYGMRFKSIKGQGEYGPSKTNNVYSKDLKDFLLATFKTGSYEKEIGATVFHANTEFIAGVIGGYFDGDGNVSVERQLIRASSRSKKLIEQVTALLGYVGLFGSMSSESSVRIKDKIQHTLCILPKFAKLYKEQVGFHMPEKAQALDEIIAYNVRKDAHAKPEAIDKIPELGNTIAETGKLLQMPGQSRIYGRWAKKDAIGRQTLEKYVEEFEAKIKELEEKVVKYDAKVTANMKILQSALNADVVWDEIVELIYHEDPKEYVYDFTVPGNDSFMVDCNVLVHNTLNKLLLRTGDCQIGCCITYLGKQCKYNYGLFVNNLYI